MTTRELLQEILDDLEMEIYHVPIKKLRAHLAKPEPEPVAQIDEFGVFKDLTDDYLPDGTRLYLKDQL